MKRRSLVILVVLVCVFALGVVSASAQTATPVPAPTVATILADSSDIVTDWGLLPFITVSAVVGVAAYLYARLRRSSR